MELSPSINIYSGEPGLGGALTNPTELARRKGSITHRYPVTYRKVTYPDAEIAFFALRTEDCANNDRLMIELIACKLRQHARLQEAITVRGGAPWLATCSHITSGLSTNFSAWEGIGLSSRFIRNLIAGYQLSLTETLVGEVEQLDLF